MTVTLIEDLHSPIGVYPAGLPVRIVARSRYRYRICLDPPGAHLTPRCHTAHLPPAAVQETP